LVTFQLNVLIGLNAGLAPMYLTEISPTHLRGAIGTIYQLVITISILTSNILGLPQILGTDEKWPILFGIKKTLILKFNYFKN
jgi:SP family facilitated glucose transporter-like MFS transporter 1